MQSTTTTMLRFLYKVFTTKKLIVLMMLWMLNKVQKDQVLNIPIILLWQMKTMKTYDKAKLIHIICKHS